MTEAAHRRMQGAAIILGIILVGVAAGLAVDGVSGNWKVGGDLVVSGSGSFADDATITDDLFVTDDCTFSDAVTVAGQVTLADSLYTAADVTLAADQILRLDYLGLRQVTGAFPDTASVPAGTIAVRGDTVYCLAGGKGSWLPLN